MIQNNGWSSDMTEQSLEMTCHIIVFYILCLLIHFSQIHNSLLHYIITSVIIDEFLSGFIYFLTKEKYFFILTLLFIYIFIL